MSGFNGSRSLDWPSVQPRPNAARIHPRAAASFHPYVWEGERPREPPSQHCHCEEPRRGVATRQSRYGDDPVIAPPIPPSRSS